LLVSAVASITIPDADACEGYVDLHLLTGDVTASPYWGYDDASASACPYGSVSSLRTASLGAYAPATCAGYLNCFYTHNYSAITPASPTVTRLNLVKYDLTPTAISAGQNVFGFSILFDNTRWPACTGCSTPVRADLIILRLHSQSGIYDRSDPGGVPQQTDSVQINETSVSARPMTWGRLKQLYR